MNMAAPVVKFLRSGLFPGLGSIRNRQRFLHTSRILLGGLDDDFKGAKERLNSLKEDPGNQVKLQIYAVFKQATAGKCNIPKPGMMDFVGKAKWDAWNSLGDLSEDDAKRKYIGIVEELAAKEAPTAGAEGTSPEAGKYQELKVTLEDGINTILLNRPSKKNAINYKMYEEWGQALGEAADNDSVVTVVTGAGDYYCSGNDLSNFANIPPEGIEKMAKEGGVILKRFVASFIDFPKPLIAVVNGPAVGVSVTVMGLFDAVYATDRATFHTPFSALGQSPEGCSSVTFPYLMGQGKANEMLLFNKKITAQEACDLGLVTEVFPDHTFQKEVWERIRGYAKLPRKGLSLSKQLGRNQQKEMLHKANEVECELLVERWQSEECVNAIMSFFSQKSN